MAKAARKPPAKEQATRAKAVAAASGKSSAADTQTKPPARSKSSGLAQPKARESRQDKPTVRQAREVAPARQPTKGPAQIEGAETGGEINLGHLQDFVGFHLRLAQDASYRVFSRYRDKDLIKPGRYPALAIIQLNPGISQSALGRAIARDKSTISPLIKDLESNGFINRKPSVHDRRSVTLSLTKKGQRTLARLHTRATDHEQEIDRLIGSSKTRLLTTLEKIVSGMAALEPA